MDIKVCDICYYKKGILIESTGTLERKSKNETVKIDVCNEHKNFLDGTKTVSETREKIRSIIKEA